MIAFLAWLAIEVFSLVLNKLLTPPRGTGDKPAEIEVPKAEAGIPIPVFYGTVQIAPNTVWFTGGRDYHDPYMNYRGRMMNALCWGLVNEVLDLSFGGKSLRNTPYSNFGFGIDGRARPAPGPGDGIPAMQLSGPGISELHSLRGGYCGQGDGHSTASPGPVNLVIAASGLYGGPNQGGGPVGNIRFYFGWDAQPVDDRLQIFLGADNTSAYPKLCYAILDGQQVDTIDDLDTFAEFIFTWNNPTPPPILFLLRRTAWVEGATSPLGSVPETHTTDDTWVGNMSLGFDANPAEIAYDLLTNALYGLGLSTALIDTPSFSACAQVLRTEVISASHTGFGLSVLIKDTKEAVAAIGDILNHIDGIIATNPVTGKLEMSLVRNDYTLTDQLVITPSNARNLKFSRGTWRETANEIRITYQELRYDTDTRGFVAAVALLQDQANYAATGSVRNQTFDMPYVTHPDIAAYIAKRHLRRASTPLAKVSWVMNREGYALKPGDVVNLTWPALGVADLPIRIGDIDYGTVQDGTITVSGTEDIFNVSTAAFTTPPTSGWVEPDTDVETITPDDPYTGITWGDSFS